MARTVEITELLLREAQQSLLETSMALEDVVPVFEDLDNASYWSVECWGGTRRCSASTSGAGRRGQAIGPNQPVALIGHRNGGPNLEAALATPASRFERSQSKAHGSAGGYLLRGGIFQVVQLE